MGGFLNLVIQLFYANVFSILDQKARTVVFANVEDILLMNTVCISSHYDALVMLILVGLLELPGGAAEGMSAVR